MKALRKHSGISLFIQASYFAFFISFICSFRAITSISLAAILLGGLIENRANLRTLFLKMLTQPFIVTCLLFFLLQVIAMLYTTDTSAGWHNVRLKTGLVFIPLAVYTSTRNMGASVKKKLFSWYCIILCAASVYCVAIACRDYLRHHESDVFFYHRLVHPFSNHAVYFSIFVCIALIYLVDTVRKKDFLFRKLFHISLIVFLSFMLVLLSSKLVIAFYAGCLLYYFILLFREKKGFRTWIVILFIAFITGILALLFTKNPISWRFRDIMHGDIGFVMQEKFDKADYFNGIQFRLLQWRLTGVILTENNSWLHGVGPGDGQALLNQQYITRNMYTGEPPAKGRRGYLDYNTHNQFLQSLLQTGIAGAAVFLLITFSLAAMAWRSRVRAYLLMVLLLIIYSLIESMFETQYGILLYSFFPLLMSNSHARNTSYINPGVSR